MHKRNKKKKLKWSETFPNNGQCPWIPLSEIGRRRKISFPIFFGSTFHLFFVQVLGSVCVLVAVFFPESSSLCTECLFLLTLIKILCAHILFRLAVCIKHKDIGVGSTGEFWPRPLLTPDPLLVWPESTGKTEGDICLRMELSRIWDALGTILTSVEMISDTFLLDLFCTTHAF